MGIAAGCVPAFVCLSAAAEAQGMITRRKSCDLKLMSCRKSIL